MTATRTLSALGSAFYLTWAALHLKAALQVVQLGDSLPASGIQGRLYQDAWMLFAAAVVVAIVSLRTFSRNSLPAYLLTLGIAGIADIGFIAFILVPGYAPLWPGLQGPITWIVGLTLSTAGLILAAKSRPVTKETS